MVKYYKIENDRLIEAPINFVNDDGSIICNFNINTRKLLEKGYTPLTPEQVQEFYDNHSTPESVDITSYRFSKLKVKEKLVELDLWSTFKESLTDDEYEDLVLADDFAFDNELFVRYYNQLKEQLPNIDELLMDCRNEN